MSKTVYIATRGSALALVQANMVLSQCREHFPGRPFDLKIIKTTGDKLQTASASASGLEVSKGLFTKELEVALLNGEADLAVHSLKDLPTELPDGLMLGAVGKREDVRDVLIYCAAGQSDTRGLRAHATIRDFAPGSTIATGSTRRQAQLLALRSDLNVAPIRGNVGTRLLKLAAQSDLDGIVLAAAGLNRLGFKVNADGTLTGEGVPQGLLAVYLSLQEMLPCVGQGAIGVETRANDPDIGAVCNRLNDLATFQCVSAERAFLHAMGGGCLSPVAAHATVEGNQVRMRAVSFRTEKVGRAEGQRPVAEAVALGQEIARRLDGA